MKKCICKAQEKGSVDGGKVVLIIWGGLLLLLLVIAFAASWIAFVAVLLAYAMIYGFMILAYNGKGHTWKCAKRRAFLELLELGGLITP